MNKVSRSEKIFYMAVGTVLVIALSVMMSVRVQSKGREAVLFDNSDYMEAEAQYRQQVQGILETYDVYNSGLTMTRVVSLNGEREYNIQINNKKIHQMEPAMAEELHRELSDCMVCLPDGSKYAVTISLNY